MDILYSATSPIKALCWRMLIRVVLLEGGHWQGLIRTFVVIDLAEVCFCQSIIKLRWPLHIGDPTVS